MKKIVSMVLVAILTLVCGMQIAADSAEPILACNHSWVYSAGTCEEVDSNQKCRIVIYDCTIQNCELCGRKNYLDKTYRTERYEHSAKAGTDGKMYCQYCWCRM